MIASIPTNKNIVSYANQMSTLMVSVQHQSMQDMSPSSSCKLCTMDTRKQAANNTNYRNIELIPCRIPNIDMMPIVIRATPQDH